MALASTSQLHSTAFVHTLSRFPSGRLPLLRCSSRKLHFPNKSIEESNPSPPPKPSPKPSWLRSWTAPRPSPSSKRPQSAVDYRPFLSSDEDEVGTSRSTGSSTMSQIVEKLKKFGYIDDTNQPEERTLPEKGSVEDIFYTEDGMLPDTRGGLTLNLNEEVRFPWEKPVGDLSEGGSERRKRSKSSMAELTLPEAELRRLRHMALRMKSRVRVKGAGVSREIVDAIHEKWRTDEVVRIKCEGTSALNMKLTHEILERKTGGLVIWRSGSSVSLYRGVTYEVPKPDMKLYRRGRPSGLVSYNQTNNGYSGVNGVNSRESSMQDNHEDITGSIEKKEGVKSPPPLKYEHEVDKLLDALGPRYEDWPGGNPLPVDADLLPVKVPEFKPPFRILPYGVKSTLGLKEATALRRLARSLPPHFALGRSRQHQGLAAAMVKLWEQSSIAKVALKRGVQLTSSERMAEDIKKLTGGVLLSRNKDFLVFYRGKNFLSPEVAEALLERESLAKALQDEEEKARLRASSSLLSNIDTVEEPGVAGTLGETLEADARWGNQLDRDHKNKMMRAAELAKHADLVRKLERRLSLAEFKLGKAETALAKVEEFLKPAERNVDPESITDEERFMFRKLGLRMKAYLLLGRRGVFDGTVENMHLHWKYRELVKVLVNAKTFSQVKNIALSLEAESGGILVSVDKVSKGFAVIVYRGKEYKRPSTLRPKNLLTKRKALARSIELQRREAISHHVSNLHRRVEQLRSELGQMENAKDHGDEDLYRKLDSAYSTEDEDSEAEGDDAYLETFGGVVNVLGGEDDDDSDDDDSDDNDPDGVGDNGDADDYDDGADGPYNSYDTDDNGDVIDDLRE